jgi:hypothetical protein
MSTLKRGMLGYMQEKNADAIAREEEPPWDVFYAPPDMHHYLQRKTADAIERGEEPPYIGLYAPPADPCVANPPAKKRVQGQINLQHHIASMAEVCHF